MFIINKYNLMKLILPFGVFLLTLYISPYFVNGDQFHYNKIYNEIPNLDFIPGFLYYHSNIASYEPIYYIIVNFFSSFMDRIVFIALSNSILVYTIIRLFEKYKVSILVGSFLILTNYYFIVLYFSAERLKYAFLFLFLFLLSKNNKSKVSFVMLSVTTHIQMFILYLAIVFKQIISSVQNIFINSKINKKHILYFVIATVILVLMQNQILNKFNSYFYNSSLIFPYKILIFFSLSMIYTKNRSEVISIFFILLVSILFLGEGRINIYGYFVFLYYAIQYKKGLNVGIFLTSSYYFYQTILFINNIFLTGDGYGHFR